MKPLIALFFAVAGTAVTYVHLKDSVQHVAWSSELSWTTAGTFAFSVITIVVGLSHLEHSLKTLKQRSVICAALAIVFVASLLCLLIGGSWLFGMIFFEAVRSEQHVGLILGMVWGGGAAAVASLFTLGAIGEANASEQIAAANDNRDPAAPLNVEPVAVPDTAVRSYSTGYDRPAPSTMTKYLA
ncbi:MAG: hypothetical protein J0H42_10120 [Rhizobiales bacterium]|nr:hypothetical protein [Hyphomicrobiales bacterium]